MQIGKTFQKGGQKEVKKYFLMFLLMSSLFGLVGCGNDEAPREDEDVEDVEEEDEIGDDEVDDE